MSDHATMIAKSRWHLVLKTKVSCCTHQNWNTPYQNQECHAEFIAHVKGSCCGVDGEVKYALFANAIRSTITATPAMTAKQRATLWAEDNDIQASHQKLDDCSALLENRSNAVATKKVEVAAPSLSIFTI